MVIVASLAMEKEHEEAAYKLPLKLKKRNCSVAIITGTERWA